MASEAPPAAPTTAMPPKEELTEDLRFQYRFYENKYPEVDELVMVNVRSIAEMGAYVSLLEYNNIEGMILLSELSRRRIRSINKLIRVGKNEVVMVLRVDKERGYIDLSKRLVSPEDIRKVEERYNKAKTVSTVLRQVSKETQISMQELSEKISFPLYHKVKLENPNEDEKKVEYMHCYDIFKMGITDRSVFDGLDISDEVKDILLKHIKRRLTPQPIKIRADIEVTCFTYDGIEAIRKALYAAQEVGDEENPIKVKLIAPPMYVVTTNTLDKQKGIEKLNEAIEAAEKVILEKKGSLNVRMKPKVVSAHEERELSLMMERLEMEKRQVDGDGDDDEQY